MGGDDVVTFTGFKLNYNKAIKYEQDPQKKNEIMNNLYKEGGTWDT